MKIEKRSPGSYRVRKTIQGKSLTLNYDHKPTQAEVLRDMSVIAETAPVKGSFLSCAESYISSKDKVLSPSTIKGYHSVLRSIDTDFKSKKIASITQQDIQLLINKYSAEHSPKSVRNLHGFVSAVLRQFRPDMNIYTTLPQKREYEHYTPSEDDIKRILEATKDVPYYHIPFQLGIMSLRRSEICALTLDDIDGNILTINKALVLNNDNEWVLKPTKTAAGTRKIYISDSLVKEIRDYGKIFEGNPTSLLYGLNDIQKKLGIPLFRFHDLRHFFASYAHSQGMTDADIMATGGWKSDYTMKQVYRHEMNAEKEQKRIFDGLF